MKSREVGKNEKQNHRLVKPIAYFFSAALIFLVTTLAYYKAAAANPLLVMGEDPSGVIRIADIAYYFAITTSFWFSEQTEVYSLDVQMEILKGLLGPRVSSSMPLNTMPPALFFWAPFAYVFKNSPALAVGLWLGFSLSFFLLAAFFCGSRLIKSSRWKEALLFFAAAAVALVSDSSGVSAVLGQTSFLAAAALMFLFILCSEKSKASRGAALICLAALLSIKPQYFALGLGVLFAYGNLYAVIGALFFFALVSLLLSPRLGFSWPLEYLETLRLYSGAAVKADYSPAFAPQYMNIFRYAFEDFLGHQLATNISWFVLFLAFLLAFCRGMSIYLKRESAFLPTSAVASILLLAAYILFSPHSGLYEEVLLLSFFGIALFQSERAPGLLAMPFLLFALAYLLNTLSLPLAYKPPLFAWAIKLGFVTALYRLSTSCDRCLFAKSLGFAGQRFSPTPRGKGRT